MNEEINNVIARLVPQVRIFLTDRGRGRPTTEIDRYLSFAWPHVGEMVSERGVHYEVWRVEHFVIDNKPHIDCYCH